MQHIYIVRKNLSIFLFTLEKKMKEKIYLLRLNNCAFFMIKMQLPSFEIIQCMAESRKLTSLQ